MTKRYAHLNIEVLRSAVAKLEPTTNLLLFDEKQRGCISATP